MSPVRFIALAGALSVALLTGHSIVAEAAPSGEPRPIVVDCSKQTLSRVLRRAKPGAVIHVNGTCSGPFIMDKNLTIIGLGGTATLTGNDSTGVVLVGAAANVNLVDLWVRDGYGCYGAGIRVLDGGTLYLSGGTIVVGNDTPSNCDGGGIYNEGNVVMADTAKVASNSARHGGGIYSVGGVVSLSDSAEISANTASGNGGGLYLQDGTAFLSGTTVVNANTGNGAGGIYNKDSTIFAGGACTISVNSGTEVGGVRNDSGVLNLSGQATMTANSGGTVGGVYNAPGITNILDSAIVLGNSPNDIVTAP